MTTNHPFTYTGREDDGTGLMYYRARYYDSELEIFISEDPMGDAQRAMAGDPISFTDPLGLVAYPTYIDVTNPQAQQNYIKVGDAMWDMAIQQPANTLLDPNASLFDKALAGDRGTLWAA